MAVEKSSVCNDIGESNSSNTATKGINTTVTLAGHGLKVLPENITSSLTALDLRYNLLEFSSVAGEKVKCELNDLSHFERLTHLNIADNKLEILPSSFGKLLNLEELNVVGNGISNLPSDIGKLSRLSRLYADFNQLSQLPTEMGSLSKLTALSLGHNNFTYWPPVLEHLKSLEIVILTGNCLTSLLYNTSSNLTYLDLRANNLHGTVDVSGLKNLQHLDVSYNCVQELNLSTLSSLRTVDCSYNQISVLIVSGESLQVISARNNKLQSVQFSQSVGKLEIFDVSFNLLSSLPEAICDASQLIILDASHNKLLSISSRLLNNGQSQLQVIKLNHNQLKTLPEIVNNFMCRCLHFQHNLLSSLPINVFTHAIRLEELNVAHNRLVNLPVVSSHHTLLLRKLYLSANLLNEDALLMVSKCPRLQVLHFAYNGLQEIPDSVLQKLPNLRELSIAANQLDQLPSTMTSLPFLENLNLHSNNFQEITTLSTCQNLKAIDLACNKLKQVSLASIVSPFLSYLDLSCNDQLQIDPVEFDSLCSERSVAVVNVNNTISSLPFTPQSDSSNNSQESPWTLGFTETFSGTARLCIDIEKKTHELSIAVVECSDSEQAELLRSFLPQLLRVERSRTEVPIQYMCNATIAAFRLIKTKWPSSEPAITLCNLALNEESAFVLRVVSAGQPAGCLLSETEDHFLVTENMDHIPSVGQDWETAVKAGFTTCNESVNEFPPKRKTCFISEPQVTEIKLKGTEKYLIVGSYALWEALEVSEILQVVQKHNKPVQGSKHLAELASTLGNKDGICAVVVILQLEKINIFCNTNSVNSDPVTHDINLSVMNLSNNILSWNDDDDKIQNDEVIEDAEKYKSWEYMLEQNHKMLFNRELETIHRSFICRTAKIQNNDTPNWCSSNNVSAAPYTPTYANGNGFPTFRGRYYCYGYYDKGKFSF